MSIFYDEHPIDTDNIIKPIQDALVGPVLADDRLVIDVECHRRLITGMFEPTRLPALLRQGLLAGKECVYVRLRDAQPLEEHCYEEPAPERLSEANL